MNKGGNTSQIVLYKDRFDSFDFKEVVAMEEDYYYKIQKKNARSNSNQKINI